MAAGFAFYKYDPSIVAAIIFVILFIVTTFIHVFQAAKGRTYYFIPLIIGGFFEWIGYIGRALAHSNQTSLSIFILQTVLLLVAPALFAGSIYMILGRIVLATRGESVAPIRAKWLTKIFVCGDVLSFLVQTGGGGLVSNAKSVNFGKKIIVLGLLLQILFFGVFLVTSCIFHVRLNRTPTPESRSMPWQKYMFALYSAGTLILIRSVFRILEFAAGSGGALQNSEAYMYVFDAVLMLGVMVGFNVVHPGAIIGRRAQNQSVPLSDRENDALYEGRK